MIRRKRNLDRRPRQPAAVHSCLWGQREASEVNSVSHLLALRSQAATAPACSMWWKHH